MLPSGRFLVEESEQHYMRTNTRRQQVKVDKPTSASHAAPGWVPPPMTGAYWTLCTVTCTFLARSINTEQGGTQV
jgi:hypothetical protein